MKELNLTRIMRTATVKDTGVVFAGNTISSILGAIFYFFLARVAGPAQFGMFAAVAAVATTAVDLFDVGINAAVINYASRAETRQSSLRSALVRKVWISGAVTLIIVLAAPIISELLGQPVLTGAIRWAALLVPAKALFSFVRSGLQAVRMFVLDAGLDILSSVVRLGLFWAFIFGYGFNPVLAAIWSYAIGLFLPAILGFKKIWRMMEKPENNIGAPGFTPHQKATDSCPWMEVPGRRPSVRDSAPHRNQWEAADSCRRSFTSYQSYMTAAFGLSAISGRLDVFFLTRLTTLEAVGLYQAAFRLFMPVQQLSGSLSRVLAPRFGGFGDKSEAKKYLHKSLLLSGGLAALMFLTVPFLPWGIKLLYGGDFTAAVGSAYWLLLYFGVFLAATPWWAKLLYFHSNAKWYAVLAGLQLIMLLILMPWLINIFGANGAAMALLGVNFVAAGTAAYLVK